MGGQSKGRPDLVVPEPSQSRRRGLLMLRARRSLTGEVAGWTGPGIRRCTHFADLGVSPSGARSRARTKGGLAEIGDVGGG